MINEIDYEFCNKYPKLYPTAETFGYSMKDANYLMGVLSSHELKFNNTESLKQMGLKSIIVRQNCNYEELVDYINEYGYFILNDFDELRAFGGLSFIDISERLIKHFLYENRRKLK